VEAITTVTGHHYWFWFVQMDRVTWIVSAQLGDGSHVQHLVTYDAGPSFEPLIPSTIPAYLLGRSAKRGATRTTRRASAPLLSIENIETRPKIPRPGRGG
jgi:hypothetical protein